MNIETIDTDNIKYNDKIDTDNNICKKLKKNPSPLEELCRAKRLSIVLREAFLNENSVRVVEKGWGEGEILYKIFIHAIDTDKNLVQLSPFITTKNKIIKNNKLQFHSERVERMISAKTQPKYKLHEEVNYLLLYALMNTLGANPPLEGGSKSCKSAEGESVAYPFNADAAKISGWGKNQLDDDVKSIIFDKKYSQYFDRAVIDFYASKNLRDDILYPLRHLNAFLHNIYYRYISSSHKKVLKALKMLDFNFKVSIDDARAVLKNDKSKYNFVFLDAFTPTKCPCLWSVDFFKLIFEHLEDGGMILTYSNSAQVRHAMIDAGFTIYKNVIDNKPQGTVAVKKAPSPLEGLCRAKRLSIVLREAFLNENSVRVIEKGWGEGFQTVPNLSTIQLFNFSTNTPPHPNPLPQGEGGYTLPLSDYELGLLHTKAGIYFRDENLSLTNEEIIALHEIEVKNSPLMSATKYKKQNLL